MSHRERAPKVDAHVHLSQWWPDVRRTGYRPDLDYTVPGILAEMDRNGVDFALAIQLFQAPSSEAALAEGRTQFGQSAGRLLPVGTVDPTRGPDVIRAATEAWDHEPELRGIKLFPGYLPLYPHDPRVGPVYEYAHRRGVPVLFHQGDTLDGLGLLKFARPLEIDEVAGRYRDVRFVLCHLGNPWIEEAAELLYKNSNVYADTSGLLPPPQSRFFAAGLERAVDQIHGAIVTCGAPEKVLFGSDWPLEDLGSASLLVERLPLSPEDRELLFGRNAARLFRIPSTHGPTRGPVGRG